MRWLNIRPVIYLDNIFLVRRMIEEILMSWDIRFFALTSGFCHEFEKINSKPSQQIELLGLKLETYPMT